MIVVWVMLLLATGVALSAFFSGSETGFYRVARVRLVLDSRAGDWIARGLLWLINNPALFVATTLIGNNVANYMTSLAIVLVGRLIFQDPSYLALAEVLMPIAAAPLIFVYGELAPKNVFFAAPGRLLRRAAPLFFVFTLLFAPVAALLWLLGRALQGMLGLSPSGAQLTLFRAELARVFDEGAEVGVLAPAQRRLAAGLFASAGRRVGDVMTPITRITAATESATLAEMTLIAQRQRSPLIPLQRRQSGPRQFIGYYRLIDLRLSPHQPPPPRPLLGVAATDRFIVALARMEAEGADMAQVTDARGATIGLVTHQRLAQSLLRAA